MTRASAKSIVTLVSLLQFLYPSFRLICTDFEEMPESLPIWMGGCSGVPVNVLERACVNFVSGVEARGVASSLRTRKRASERQKKRMLQLRMSFR